MAFPHTIMGNKDDVSTVCVSLRREQNDPTPAQSNKQNLQVRAAKVHIIHAAATKINTVNSYNNSKGQSIYCLFGGAILSVYERELVNER
jgi:hypothetical protein